MNALFDSAALAIVAYVEVLADGTSAGTNSGVITAHGSPGVYTVTLPTSTTGGLNQAQPAGRDLFIVEPLGVTPLMHSVLEISDSQKNIIFSNGSSFVDNAFNLIILRTIIPPSLVPPGPA